MKYLLLTFIMMLSACKEEQLQPSSYAELSSGLGVYGECEGVHSRALESNIPFNLQECLTHVSKPKFKIGQVLKIKRDPDLYGPNKYEKITILNPVYFRRYSSRIDTVGFYEKAYQVSSNCNNDSYADFRLEKDLLK